MVRHFFAGGPFWPQEVPPIWLITSMFSRTLESVMPLSTGHLQIIPAPHRHVKHVAQNSAAYVFIQTGHWSKLRTRTCQCFVHVCGASSADSAGSLNASVILSKCLSLPQNAAIRDSGPLVHRRERLKSQRSTFFLRFGAHGRRRNMGFAFPCHISWHQHVDKRCIVALCMTPSRDLGNSIERTAERSQG